MDSHINRNGKALWAIPDGFTNGFVKGANIVSPTFPAAPFGKDAFDKIGEEVKPVWLFKFSKKNRAQDMYKSGIFRIAPASFYNDPSLNIAIRDDELVFNGPTHTKLTPMTKVGKF